MTYGSLTAVSVLLSGKNDRTVLSLKYPDDDFYRLHKFDHRFILLFKTFSNLQIFLCQKV